MSIVHTVPEEDLELAHVTEGVFCWCEATVWVPCLYCETGCDHCDKGWRQVPANLLECIDHELPIHVMHNNR